MGGLPGITPKEKVMAKAVSPEQIAFIKMRNNLFQASCDNGAYKDTMVCKQRAYAAALKAEKDPEKKKAMATQHNEELKALASKSAEEKNKAKAEQLAVAKKMWAEYCTPTPNGA